MIQAPYFSEGVLERARATQANLEKINFDRENEPKVLARAIRDIYTDLPLVRVIQKSFAERSKLDGCDIQYRFHSPKLVLAKNGFRASNGRAIGSSIPLGDCADAATALRRIDAELVRLAERPAREDDASSVASFKRPARECQAPPARESRPSESLERVKRPGKVRRLLVKALDGSCDWYCAVIAPWRMSRKISAQRS